MSSVPPRRIALFGGTFDPIHAGHLDIAARAKEALALDEVRFLPCLSSPHKSGDTGAAADERLAMVQLAIRDLPWAVADDFDLKAPPPSYSYRTAEEMAGRFPGARLFWIMGADQWRALPAWKEPERLARLVEFIVFARDGEPAAHPGWRLHFLPGTHPASATAIRRELAAGRLPHEWLDPGVLGYILGKRLYNP